MKIFRVHENFDGKSTSYIDGPWFGQIIETLNDHEFRVKPILPWVLPIGHAEAMLGSHDKLEEHECVMIGRFPGQALHFFLTLAKEKFNIFLVSSLGTPIDETKEPLASHEVFEWLWQRREM